MSGFWFLLSLVAGAQEPMTEGTLSLLAGGKTVTAEVADDHTERAQGLMGRTSLGPDRGMLFVYPAEQVRSFWMKNTPMALSIAFLDAQGQVVHIAELEPMETTPVSSKVPAMYAIEMRRGWFEDNGVKRGQRVAGLPGPSKE